MKHYSVKKLCGLAGVSVRTLHYYDQTGLLKPSIRTEAGYRLYGEKELIRLQQILFYRELDFTLEQIKAMLDNTDFDVIQALKTHKTALKARRKRIDRLLNTVDKTILKLKGEQEMTDAESLYEGFTREETDARRKEAREKYGDELVNRSEQNLVKLSKHDIANMKAESTAIIKDLTALIGRKAEDLQVQAVIKRHYNSILGWWAGAVPEEKVPDAYLDLADVYRDERFYAKEHPGLKPFLCEGIRYFVQHELKK